MNESNRAFRVEYNDMSMQDGTYDVSFTLTEDAEDLLFRALEQEISDDVRSGTFADQKVHLYKRLAEQSQSHPPWIEANDDARVYDLVVTEWDYHLLSKIIGSTMSDLLGPDAAGKYEELLSVWNDITDQMRESDTDTYPPEQKTFDSVIDDYGQSFIDDAKIGDTENSTFKCLIRGGDVMVYENEDGSMWYECSICHDTFNVLGDHDCQ